MSEPFEPVTPSPDPVDPFQESFLGGGEGVSSEPESNIFQAVLQGSEPLDFLNEIPKPNVEPIVGTRRGDNPPKTPLGKFVDFIRRPGYATAKLVDDLLNMPGVALGRALTRSFSELTNPRDRLSFSDVIRRSSPVFAQSRPVGTEVMGFAADVAFDPLNLLMIGPFTKTVHIPRLVSTTLKKAGIAGDEALALLAKNGHTKPGFMRDKLFNEWLSGIKSTRQATAESMGLRPDAPIVREFLSGDKADVLRRAEIGGKMLGQTEQQIIEFQKRFGALSDLKGARGIVAGEEFITQRGTLALTKEGQRELSSRLNDIRDLMGPKKDKSPHHVLEESFLAAKETVYQDFSRLIFSDPIAAHKFTRPKSALSLKLPFLDPIELLPQSVVKTISELPVLKRIGEALDNTLVLRNAKRMFMGGADIPPELQNAMQVYLAHKSRANDVAVRFAAKFFHGVSREDQELIGKALSKINDEAATLQANGNLKPGQVSDLMRSTFDQMGLQGNARTKAGEALGVMQDLRRLEQEVGLLNESVAGYFPRMWNIIEDPQAVKQWLRSTSRRDMDPTMESFFGPDQGRTVQEFFDQEQILTRSGEIAEPVYHAGVLMANRVLVHERGLADLTLKHTVAKALPGAVFDPRTGKLDVGKMTAESKNAIKAVYGVNSWPKAKRIVENIASRVNFLQEGMYRSGTAEEFLVAQRGWDKMLKLFRSSATIWKPGFSLRQFPAGIFQAALRLGTDAINPKSFMDSWMIQTGKANKMGPIRSVTGEALDGELLKNEMMFYNVYRNATVEGLASGGGFVPRTGHEFNRATRRLKLHKNESVNTGTKALFADSWSNYMNFPMLIEDNVRGSTYITLRKLGHNPVDARKLVDDAHFDYFNGMSSFEQRLMRRVIPFYSFQRFSLGLAAKVATSAPGRIANFDRFTETLMTAYGKYTTGEELTPEERSLVPGWLLDSVSAFRGFDDAGKAVFSHLTSVNPLDALALLRPTNKGDVDVRQTMLNGGLASLAPMLKVPLEWALKKNFFTGAMIDRYATERKVNPEQFLTALLGMAMAGGVGSIRGPAGTGTAAGLLARVGQINPTVAGLGGAAAGAIATEVDPEFAKRTLGQLLGMEEGINEKGEKTTFFSPMRFHVMTSFLPGLNDALRVADPDLGPKEKTAAFLFGIPTTYIDVHESVDRQFKQETREESTLRSAQNQAAVENRWNAWVDATQNLQQFYVDLAERYNNYDPSALRSINQPLQ